MLLSSWAVAMCMGSEEHAFCADPDDFCAMSSDATFTLCLPTCDPVEPNCLVDQACVPIGPNWSCAPDVRRRSGVLHRGLRPHRSTGRHRTGKAHRTRPTRRSKRLRFR